MINFKNYDDRSIVSSLDYKNTMLIIGEGKNNEYINSVQHFTSKRRVKKVYGESELSQAFDIAKEIGAPHIFLLNMKRPEDHIDVVDFLKDHDFTYIVPVNIDIHSHFFDRNRGGSRITYVRDYLERLTPLNETKVVFTGKHASLYEDLDTFLEDYFEEESYIQNLVVGNKKGRGILFALNNLKEHNMANVALAASLSVGDLSDHPILEGHEAVFYLNRFDVREKSIVIFRDTHSNGLSIDNLVSFEKQEKLRKSVYADRIITYIERTEKIPDFSGSLYSAHKKVLVERGLEDYFDSLIGWIIRDYRIDSVRFIKEGLGVGRIESVVTVWIKSTTEEYTITIGG